MKTPVKNNEKCKLNFIKKSNEKYNYKYDYSKVKYINSITKVELICIAHGSFWVRPDAHIRKVGCPKCNGGIKLTLDDFIKKSLFKHGSLYNYEKVKYINSINKVELVCKDHGSFWMLPANHIFGQKCPSCMGVKRKNVIDFIKESIALHGDLYDYSLSHYINNNTKTIIICPIHGEFKQEPKMHLRGHGCSKCKCNSSGEKLIKKLLDKYNIIYEEQLKLDGCSGISGGNLPFDFYIKEFNMCIEFDGKQHYQPVERFGGNVAFEKLKLNDTIRNEYCEKNGIILLRIKYNQANDLDKLETILKLKSGLWK